MNSYLNMLVMSIPTNMIFTGSQTFIRFHVSGSVDITPIKLNVDTIITEIKFCIHRISDVNVNILLTAFILPQKMIR